MLQKRKKKPLHYQYGYLRMMRKKYFENGKSKLRDISKRFYEDKGTANRTSRVEYMTFEQMHFDMHSLCMCSNEQLIKRDGLRTI